MDRKRLVDQGFHPTGSIVGYVEGYQLKIGERATMIRSEGCKVYGVVMSLKPPELQRLYSGEGVEDYLPEDVEVTTLEGGVISAAVYNLPAHKLTGRNPKYVEALVEVGLRLGLPKSYIDEIQLFP